MGNLPIVWNVEQITFCRATIAETAAQRWMEKGKTTAKNDFQEKQRQRDRKFFNAGMNFGLQLANDFFQMTIHDKTVMGSRVMGRSMIERIAAHTVELDDHFSNAFGDDVEADYLQEEMDGVLREIFGDDLIPFAKRYPTVKQYGYLKSRKGWK